MPVLMVAIVMGVLALSAGSFYKEDAITADRVGQANGQHFVVYRGAVQQYAKDNPGLGEGVITDSGLELPKGWSLPRYSHHARLHSDGRIYVWSEQDAAFFHDVMKEGEPSMTLCHVLDTRQCVNHLSQQSILPATETPAFIASGSTVYVWKH